MPRRRDLTPFDSGQQQPGDFASLGLLAQRMPAHAAAPFDSVAAGFRDDAGYHARAGLKIVSAIRPTYGPQAGACGKFRGMLRVPEVVMACG